MNLGENIYRLRTEKNLSQGDLADVLEVSRQSISKWENNSAVPELDKLIKIAQIFGTTIDALVTGEKTEESSAEATAQAPKEPQQAAPVRQGLSPVQILGIILLVFGGLCLIIFTVVGIFTGAWALGVCIALPFLICGTICLLCKHNVGLKCAWVIFILLGLFCTVFMARL